jgi:hypothetical protein
MSVITIQEGDYGTLFTATVKDEANAVVDISTATVKQLIFIKPTEERLVCTMSFVTDGSNGQIKYALVNGDINMSGLWKRQYHVEMPTGAWSSSVIEFTVGEAL